MDLVSTFMSPTVAKQKRARAQRRNGRAPRTAAKAARSNGGAPKEAGAGERRGGQGGRRLADAFEIVSRLPALAEFRRRLLQACESESSSAGEIAEVIESDVGLTIAVARAAGDDESPPSRAGGVRHAVDALGVADVRVIAATIETYDPLESPGPWSERNERFRRHAVATRHAADRISELARLGDRDELVVAALLHDVGRLVLTELYSDFEGLGDNGTSPDERIRRERRELGVDHALVGAVLARRWGLPASVALAIERHHAPDAEGNGAAIRLADLIVHYADGDAAPPEALVAAAKRVGLERERLVPLLYEFPHSGVVRRRASDPCPLSERELDALRGLAEGKVYKQIAHELSLSVSTIRTHLHNVYRKIGAVDRAQAVLIARDRGWI